MKVSIIGAGYVGLVTGACLADKGHEIVCVDTDPEKVDRINRAITPIYEHGLDELLKKHVPVRLNASTNTRRAVLDTDLTFVTVGTPFDGNAIDLGAIKGATREIGAVLAEKSTYHVVVVKSTVVPGTTDDVIRPILEETSGKRAGVDFGLAMNPEFLTEGEAVQDFMMPDRLVLGTSEPRTLAILEELYTAFSHVERVRTNSRTAEMIKYASNALLATMISFSNEVANLCDGVGGIDAADVMTAIHLSKYLTTTLATGDRVAPAIVSFLWPGCGFGGSCLPKDVKALIAHGARAARPMPLLEAVIRTNEQQPRQVIRLLRKHFPSLEGLSVAVLGLAFRPGTSDMRESPSIPIINALLAANASVHAFDPAAPHEAKILLSHPRLAICDDLMAAVRDRQAIVLLTRWPQFEALPELLAALDPQPLVVDGRRMLDKHRIGRYEGIGL